MTTTITLPETLAEQLQQQATKRKRSVEALAIEYLTAALTEEASVPVQPVEDDAELLALVARIQAMPPNPARIIPAKGNLAEVLRALEAREDDYDMEAERAALGAAEAELHAINRADDSAEGRG